MIHNIMKNIFQAHFFLLIIDFPRKGKIYEKKFIFFELEKIKMEIRSPYDIPLKQYDDEIVERV